MNIFFLAVFLFSSIRVDLEPWVVPVAGIGFGIFIHVLLDEIIPRYRPDWIGWYENKWQYSSNSRVVNVNDKRDRRTLFINISAYFICLTVFARLYLHRQTSLFDIRPDPILLTVLKIFLAMIVSKFNFDVFHTVLHTSELTWLTFWKIHVYHHKFKQPRALDAFDSGFVEFILTVLFSVILPAGLLRLSVYEFLIFNILVIYSSMLSHLSYEFKNQNVNQFLFHTQKHYLHHQKYHL